MSRRSLELPRNILDAIVPGYSVLDRTLFELTGVDVSFYVSLYVLLFIFLTAFRVTVLPICVDVFRAFRSTVIVDITDDLYDQILSWQRDHDLMHRVRSLRVTSPGHYDPDGGFNDDHSGVQHKGIFNFFAWVARAPFNYYPNASTGFFFHKGYLFRILQEIEKLDGIFLSRRLNMVVLWPSTRPLKSLVEEVRQRQLSRNVSRTQIYRPGPSVQKTRAWRRIAYRPSRPITTVVLDKESKDRLVADMNKFLFPETGRWYANRGIPYRRGYLFHGPPGTGKTSMGFALAGVFGLSIFCISLSERSVTEEELVFLLNGLPHRCIVLLEDIDSSGISRPESGGPGPTGLAGKSQNAISLAGLLNAIDGVGSSEGRILIMTTNYPDRLDKALVRDGRVDIWVEFKMAKKRQIRELFVCMYSGDASVSYLDPTKISEVLPDAKSGKRVRKPVEDSKGIGKEGSLSALDEMQVWIDSLARRFADALPDGVLSAAQIQGFLLTRKGDPVKAVEDVAHWEYGNLNKEMAGHRDHEQADTDMV